MRTAEEMQDEINRLDGQLAECRNLVSALSFWSMIWPKPQWKAMPR